MNETSTSTSSSEVSIVILSAKILLFYSHPERKRLSLFIDIAISSPIANGSLLNLGWQIKQSVTIFWILESLFSSFGFSSFGFSSDDFSSFLFTVS